MSATERGRRSDSLYYDNVSRRELCDKVAFLESDLREERKKVSELHKQVEQVHLSRVLDQNENEALRELVQYICDESYGDDWFVEKAAALGIEGHY